MITKTAIRIFFVGVVFGSGFSLSAQEPVNFVLALLDDVGAGWIAPYADRLSPDDLEASVVDFYSERSKTKRKQRSGKRAIEQGYKGSCVAEDDPLHNGFDTYFGYNNHAGAYYECSFLRDNSRLEMRRFLTQRN